MDTSALSLDQGPPIGVPLRFFVAGPLFGLGAAAWLALSPEGAFLDRYAPHVLALTHFVALGFLALVMIGALFQVLPVVAGASIARPGLVGGLVLGLVALGVLGLTHGLATFRFGPVAAPIVALFLGLGLFLFAALRALLTTQGRGESVTGLVLALLGLLVTALLGGLLVLGNVGVRLPFARPDLTNLHLSAGLAAWALLLVSSVAYQVVPMFYVSPPYPPRFRRCFAPAVFALVLLCIAATWAGVAFGVGWLRLAPLLLAAPPALFAAVTLTLFARRRRRLAEPSVLGWRLACVLALAASGAFVAAELAPPTFAMNLLAGGLAFAALVAVVTGMLLKIVPFLVWFHLQSLWMARLQRDPSPVVAAFVVPSLKDVLSDRAGYLVLGAFVLAAAALLSAFVGPPLLGRLAALPVALFFGGLLYVPLRGYAVYRRGLRALSGPAKV